MGSRTRPRGLSTSASLEVLLVADRVGATEHRELRLALEVRERRRLEEAPDGRDERARVLGQRHDGNTLGIVHVLVEDCVDPSPAERLRKRRRLARAAEGLELHIEATVEGGGVALGRTAVLGDVRLVGDDVRTLVDARSHALSESQAAASFAW